MNEILFDPETTPAEWLDQRPDFACGAYRCTEELGSFLVFLLAAVWFAAGELA